jgi:hypothetical protein
MWLSPTWDVDVGPGLFCVVLSFVDRGLAMGQLLIQGVIPAAEKTLSKLPIWRWSSHGERKKGLKIIRQLFCAKT